MRKYWTGLLALVLVTSMIIAVGCSKKEKPEKALEEVPKALAPGERAEEGKQEEAARRSETTQSAEAPAIEKS